MRCCNEPSVALTASVRDPALHVNYAKGMVLGVDDFTQEFAYLAGRDQWAVRELLGYGTTSGLAVTVEDAGVEGPRVHVKQGAAAVPSGKLVCVPSDQCALINKWLAKPEYAKEVNALLTGSPPTSPPASPPISNATISLYLTLCYADCLTAPVPIPGEPCRSEDDLMAPSRIADDYKLELRTEAPPQTEEDAVRDFVAWLKQVPIVDTSPPPPADEALWIAGLKEAAQPWFDAMNASPPSSPPASFAPLGDYLFDSPPTTLSIAKENLCEFLRVAFRFWVTDLRPFWMTRACGTTPKADDDCLLLARLDVPIVLVGGSPTGAWQVSGGAAGIGLDESRRPYLAHMRLLQEWLLCGCACDAGGAGAPTDLPQGLAPSSSPDFAGLTTTGAVQIAITTVSADLTLDASHHCVVCIGGRSLALPKCAPNNRGRVYIVKSPGADSKIASDAADTIDSAGNPTTAVPAGKALTLVSDGANTWHIVAALA